MPVWQHVEKVTVSGSSTETVAVTHKAMSRGLTIWALSDVRSIDMSFQFRINGQNFGREETIDGVAADVVFSSGGARTENIMFPFVSTSNQGSPQNWDPCDMSLFITNNDGSDADVTIAFVVQT